MRLLHPAKFQIGKSKNKKRGILKELRWREIHLFIISILLAFFSVSISSISDVRRNWRASKRVNWRKRNSQRPVLMDLMSAVKQPNFLSPQGLHEDFSPTSMWKYAHAHKFDLDGKKTRERERLMEQGFRRGKISSEHREIYTLLEIHFFLTDNRNDKFKGGGRFHFRGNDAAYQKNKTQWSIMYLIKSTW